MKSISWSSYLGQMPCWGPHSIVPPLLCNVCHRSNYPLIHVIFDYLLIASSRIYAPWGQKPFCFCLSLHSQNPLECLSCHRHLTFVVSVSGWMNGHPGPGRQQEWKKGVMKGWRKDTTTDTELEGVEPRQGMPGFRQSSLMAPWFLKPGY